MVADPEKTTDNPLECPSCGYREFVRMPAISFVAFSKDYVCRRCVTRFPAPTPRWAAILFTAIGVSMALIGFLTFFLSFSDLNTIAMLIGGFIASTGLRIVWFGIKAMRSTQTDRQSKS